MKPVSTLVLILSSAALGCQAGEGETVSHTSQKSQVVTVPEVARSAVMTIYATLNHSDGNLCFDTSTNNRTWSHPGYCANHKGHGGRWQMDYKAYCARQDTYACQESYPVLTGRRRQEVATWKGVSEHASLWHGDWWYTSCGRYYHSGGWEGANWGDASSKGDVFTTSATAQEIAVAALGVGYAAKHDEQQATLAPAVFLSTDGIGGALGIEFSYQSQAWGNGNEVQCEYRCDWDGATEEVVLKEKCWEVGLEDSDEAEGMIKTTTGLQLDETWRELSRKECHEDDPGDDGSDDSSDDSSDDGPVPQDAGGGGSQDGGPGGGNDGGPGGGNDGGPGGGNDGGPGGNDGGAGGGGDAGVGGDAGPGGPGEDAGSGGGGPDGGTDGGPGPWPGDGGPWPGDGGPGPWPGDGGPWPGDGGPWPRDAGPTSCDGGAGACPQTPTTPS